MGDFFGIVGIMVCDSFWREIEIFRIEGIGGVEFLPTGPKERRQRENCLLISLLLFSPEDNCNLDLKSSV